jgi:hypothetical protein
MTTTVKFPAELEADLLRYAAQSGMSKSSVVREAVARYIVAAPRAPSSAYELGADLFGRFQGPADLAITRKAALADVWADKHTTRRRRASR